MSQNILVVAAHPDDEVLGCGGTIARHARQGDAVSILIVAEGATSRDKRRDEKARAGQIDRLRAAAREAARSLGAEPPVFLGLPDNRLDGIELLDIVKPIEDVLRRVRPNVVYTHHSGDLNIDHQRVHAATVTACRPQPGCTVRELYFFEVPSSTEWAAPGTLPFTPQVFVELNEELGRKLAALNAYAQEMRPWPHPRSARAVESLARWRGASIGADAAEAFLAGRILIGQTPGPEVLA